jgi:2-amino-4-hydroxy-6-hydroxymethyldihydropteridine diphosphokinase
MSSPATIGLGSNLGDRLAILQAAVDAIAKLPGVVVDGVSPVYETLPVGGPSQPDYLNAVVTVDTTLSPRELLDGLHEIESAAGRVREVRWGARTLDLDIVSFGETLSDDPVLTLPHPRAASRAFVLAPWRDLVPGAVIPGVGSVASLLAEVGTEGVRRTDHQLRAPAA